MKKSILLVAPVLTRSGYGEQSRFALRALRSREDLFDIHIIPLQWGKTSWINDDTDERRWIDHTIEKTINYIQQGGTMDVSLQVTIPNEWENRATINIGYTAGIETTKVASNWIEKGNQMDKIIVVSNHSKEVYKKTAYEVATEEQEGDQPQAIMQLLTDVTAVNYPVKQHDNLEEVELDLDYDFNFVCMAQLGPRKNVINTIKWFVEEFRNEEVGLVLKTNMAKNSSMDREYVYTQITGLLNTDYSDRKCKVYLLHGDMSDEEIHAIYAHPKIKASVLLSHGEGFGLPLFEAAYSGIPTVATGWSGQLDFLCDENRKDRFYNVSFDLNHIPEQVVWENVLIKESMWAYPREISAKEQMRLCYNDIINNTKDSFAAGALQYADELKLRFEEQKMYKAFVDALGLDMGEFDVESWLGSLDIQEIE